MALEETRTSAIGASLIPSQTIARLVKGMRASHCLVAGLVNDAPRMLRLLLSRLNFCLSILRHFIRLTNAWPLDANVMDAKGRFPFPHARNALFA